MFIVYCTESFLICVFSSKSILVCVRLIPGIHMIPKDFPNQKNISTGLRDVSKPRSQRPYILIGLLTGCGHKEKGGMRLSCWGSCTSNRGTNQLPTACLSSNTRRDPQTGTKIKQEPLLLEVEHRFCQKEEQTQKATSATSVPN